MTAPAPRAGTRRRAAEMPSHVTERRSLFDVFADKAARFVAQAPFFAACVGLIVLWLAFLPVLGFSEAWSRIITTVAALVTFLMVAVLENATRRNHQALQHKLNAIAEALADFMEERDNDLRGNVAELRAAIGIEEFESADNDNTAVPAAARKPRRA